MILKQRQTFLVQNPTNLFQIRDVLQQLNGQRRDIFGQILSSAGVPICELVGEQTDDSLEGVGAGGRTAAAGKSIISGLCKGE